MFNQIRFESTGMVNYPLHEGYISIKVIIDKSRDGVSLVEQYTMEYVSWPI